MAITTHYHILNPVRLEVSRTAVLAAVEQMLVETEALLAAHPEGDEELELDVQGLQELQVEWLGMADTVPVYLAPVPKDETGFTFEGIDGQMVC